MDVQHSTLERSRLQTTYKNSRGQTCICQCDCQPSLMETAVIGPLCILIKSRQNSLSMYEINIGLKSNHCFQNSKMFLSPELYVVVLVTKGTSKTSMIPTSQVDQ